MGVVKVDFSGRSGLSGRSDGPTGIDLRTSALICGLSRRRLGVGGLAFVFASIRGSFFRVFHFSLFTNHQDFPWVHYIVGVECLFNGAHNGYGFAVLGYQGIDFAATDAVFTGAGAVHR